MGVPAVSHLPPAGLQSAQAEEDLGAVLRALLVDYLAAERGLPQHQALRAGADVEARLREACGGRRWYIRSPDRRDRDLAIVAAVVEAGQSVQAAAAAAGVHKTTALRVLARRGYAPTEDGRWVRVG